MINTIEENKEAKIEVKKSQFISNIFYVENEEEAKKYIDEIKSKYHDAKHVCYAYVIDDITEDEVKKLDQSKQKDKAEDIISTFIVNQLGINLVAVKDIQVDRQSDGQIKQIKIDFIPDNKV